MEESEGIGFRLDCGLDLVVPVSRRAVPAHMESW